MSPSPLSLFPSPATSLPRKPSSRRAKASPANASTELNLRGVAFQVVTSSRKTARIQPAADTFKHSLFCDDALPSEASPPSMDRGPAVAAETEKSSPRSSLLRRQSRTRRKSGPLTMDLPLIGGEDAISNSEEPDVLSDLPQNSHFSPSTPPRRTLSTRSRTKAPQNLSTLVQPDHVNVPVTPTDEKIDELTPLPPRANFTPPSRAPESHPPPTFRAGSPSPSKSPQSPESYYTVPMRSMFPIYDPTKPLARQSYYPSPSASPPPAYLGDNVSKTGSSAVMQTPQRFDSVVGLLDGYEHIPAAAHGDMQALWKASCEDFPVAGQKVQFGLYQPPGDGKTLAIGTSSEDLIYAMERDGSGGQINNGKAVKQFAVRKHCPTARSSSLASTLVLPDHTSGKVSSKSAQEITTIFPHAAAMQAIEAILSTPEASHISTFDPTAQSPEAAGLARDAVTEAHRRYCCELIKRTRKRDSLGSVTAHYDLMHPILGKCPVTVTKSLAARSISGPRAKISLHHPSATPAAVAADTLNLAFIDFAHDACVLDIPGLLALDSHYIVDTVVSTLLAVAVIENDALVAETLVFDAPPQTPLNGKSKKQQQKKKEKKKTERGSSSVASSGMFRRSGTKKAKKEKEEEPMMVLGEEVELGGVAKGVLAVMEVTFKASAWVIVTGAKVGFGVVGYGVDKIQKRIG